MTAQTTEYKYDRRDRTWKIIYPDGHPDTKFLNYLYTGAGKVQRRTDQNGTIT